MDPGAFRLRAIVHASDYSDAESGCRDQLAQPGNMWRASRAAERPDVQPRVSVAERSSS
jgi:hypothetical protein